MSSALTATLLLACVIDADPRFGGNGTPNTTPTTDTGTPSDTGDVVGGDAPVIASVDWMFEDAPNTSAGTNLVLLITVDDEQDDVPGGVLNVRLDSQQQDLPIDDGSGTGARLAYFEDGYLVTNINVPEDAYDVGLIVFDVEENESNEYTLITE